MTECGVTQGGGSGFSSVVVGELRVRKTAFQDRGNSRGGVAAGPT